MNKLKKTTTNGKIQFWCPCGNEIKKNPIGCPVCGRHLDYYDLATTMVKNAKVAGIKVPHRVKLEIMSSADPESADVRALAKRCTRLITDLDCETLESVAKKAARQGISSNEYLKRIINRVVEEIDNE